jgi:hypothetical protein
LSHTVKVIGCAHLEKEPDRTEKMVGVRRVCRIVERKLVIQF